MPLKILVWGAEGIYIFQLPFSWRGRKGYPWERVDDGIAVGLRGRSERTPWGRGEGAKG